MTWTAVVPLKAAVDRKSRLGSNLSVQERIALSQGMTRRVIAALRSAHGIDRIFLLTPDACEWLDVEWLADTGTGLNAELTRVRSELGDAAMLVVHADLPLLTSGDIEALLAGAAVSGLAVAPDRHDTGTNAVALASERPFRFAFGPNSFQAHTGQGECAVVRRPSLSHDVDTPADLEMARSAAEKKPS